MNLKQKKFMFDLRVLIGYMAENTPTTTSGTAELLVHWYNLKNQLDVVPKLF